MLTSTMLYAGIGSRKTPEHHLATMRDWGRKLADRGWTLRSGAAEGADSAFEAGALDGNGACEIMLPWQGFNGHLTGWAAERFAAHGRATRIAAQFHPAWGRLTRPQRSLMVRNVFQIHGRNLRSPVDFVLCWAPRPGYDHEGRIIDVAGGTGLAVRVAAAAGIPVCHLDYHISMRDLPDIIAAAEQQQMRPASTG